MGHVFGSEGVCVREVETRSVYSRLKIKGTFKSCLHTVSKVPALRYLSC